MSNSTSTEAGGSRLGVIEEKGVQFWVILDGVEVVMGRAGDAKESFSTRLSVCFKRDDLRSEWILVDEVAAVLEDDEYGVGVTAAVFCLCNF
jgi:hypothetical protein